MWSRLLGSKEQEFHPQSGKTTILKFAIIARSEKEKANMINSTQENTATHKKVETENNFNTLPYGTNCKDILKLINVIKLKENNAEAIEKLYSKPNITQTINLLKILDISQDGLSFSEQGRNYAYEADIDKKQAILLQYLLKYPAYEYFILHILCHDFQSSFDIEENYIRRETTLLAIERYWTQFQYGSSETNIHDGAILFGQLVELAGLGKFIVGRRGEKSRIQWKKNARDLINKVYNLVQSSDNKLGKDKFRYRDNKSWSKTNINSSLYSQTSHKKPTHLLQEKIDNDNKIKNII
ncbi:MAG: hypothetical protein AAF298_05690, partial [Cyanobacteria bacterium P01_A01_bin.40]